MHTCIIVHTYVYVPAQSPKKPLVGAKILTFSLIIITIIVKVLKRVHA